MSAFGILLLRPLSPICDMRQSFPLCVFAHFLSSKFEKVHGSNGCWWRLLYKGSAWGNYWRGVFKETSSETFARNPDVFPCLSFSAFTLRMGSCWLYRVGWSSLRFIRCFARRTDGTHSGLLRISCLPLQPKTDVLGYVICARIQHLIPTIVHDHPCRNLGSGWSPCPSVPARKQGRLCWDTDGDDQSIPIQEALPVNPGHLCLWDPIFGSLQPQTEIVKSMLSRAPQIHYVLFNCPTFSVVQQQPDYAFWKRTEK